MAHRDFTRHDQFLDLCWEIEKAQSVRNRRSAFANCLLFLLSRENSSISLLCASASSIGFKSSL